jgi:hypothetical protein
MNEILLIEALEAKREKQKESFQQIDDKIKEMSEEEKDLLYKKIIKEEEEIFRKQKRDTKIYAYLASQVK